MITLIPPTRAMEKAAMAFRQAFFDAGEPIINGSCRLDMSESYDEWLAILRDETVSETYFAVNEANELVGIINFRRELIGFYADKGHIGYSVLPAQRQKGYATAMLHTILGRAAEIGLHEVKVVCLADNLPSIKTVLNNGGVFERAFELEGELCHEYNMTEIDHENR